MEKSIKKIDWSVCSNTKNGFNISGRQECSKNKSKRWIKSTEHLKSHIPDIAYMYKSSIKNEKHILFEQHKKLIKQA